uniref:Uncharacterized protein n=1 Tax=Magallana gigas TaxID=29159 RepID=K1R112_MAGGI
MGNLVRLMVAGIISVFLQYAAGYRYGVWLGFHDMHQEGNYVTLSSGGGKICYSNWHRGEPNNYGKNTPGIGDKGQTEFVNMTMEYIPNALAFIFVVNVVNAGGFQDDRFSKSLDENMESFMSAIITRDYPLCIMDFDLDNKISDHKFNTSTVSASGH